MQYSKQTGTIVTVCPYFLRCATIFILNGHFASVCSIVNRLVPLLRYYVDVVIALVLVAMQLVSTGTHKY